MQRYKIVLITGLLALTVTACAEDGGDDGIASVDDDATTSAAASDEEDEFGYEMALEYAECMRENGIADFADPKISGDELSQTLPRGLDPESEEFQAADTACAEFRPEPGEDSPPTDEDIAAMVAYAECMRENGIADFPDPDPNGSMDFDSDSIDMDSDEFQAAEEACADVSPGDVENEEPGGDE